MDLGVVVLGFLRWRALIKEAETRLRRFRYGSGLDGLDAEIGIAMGELGDEETREKMNRERRKRKQRREGEEESGGGIIVGVRCLC